MDGHRAFRYTSLVAVAMCWITILLGGNVIVTDSGLGCSTWPSCDGTFFPAISGAMGIEWVHRLSAFFLALIIALLLILAVAYERRRPAALRLSVGAFVLVIALAFLGAAVVDSDLNIGLVLLHFGVATILFGALLVLALIVNWKFIPQRWHAWATQEAEPSPPRPTAHSSPSRPFPPKEPSTAPEPSPAVGQA